MESAFWLNFNRHFIGCSDKIKSVLKENGFNSLRSFLTVKTNDDFKELFFEFSTRTNLNIGEKAEIKYIFNKLQNLTPDSFEVTDIDDLTVLLEEVKEKVRNNPILMDDLREFVNPKMQSPPLNKLLREAEKNFIRGSTGNRFDEDLINLCIYIYIQGGSKLYESLSQISSIPGVDHIRKKMYSLYPYVNQGKLYIKELKNYLIERNCKLEIGIAYDDTRMKKSVIYDEQSSSLVGLKVPLDSFTGLPNENELKIQTPSDVLKCVEKYPPGLFLQIILAVPFADDVPSFPIAIFVTNADVTSEEIEKRIEHLVEECEKEEIIVKFISSNGAPAQLGGMKRTINFGVKYCWLGYTFPYDFMHHPPCFQDTIHDLNKLKLCLMDDLNHLKMGNAIASGTHLLMLVKDKNISKADHKLNLTDVLSSDKTKDKMNFHSTEKILNQCVIEALKNICGTEGTRKYLEIMQYIYDGFLNPKLSTEDRISKVFYAVSFLRRWRKYLKNTPGLSADNFITTNSWHCLEINAGLLIRLALNGEGQFIVRCGSQECESFFRSLRSFTPAGLTQINFTFYDAAMKVNRILVLETVVNDLSKKGIELRKKRFNLDSQEKKFPVREEPLSPHVIESLIREASKKAEIDAKQFGINENDELDLQYFPASYTGNIRSETIDYCKLYYDTQEFEYENLITGEITNYNSVRIENRYFLDVPARNHTFKMVNANSDNGYDEVPISTFLYYLLEKGESLTNDRLLRFKSNDRKEWRSIPMQINEIIMTRDHVTIGDIVTVRDAATNSFKIGQILKFEKITESGSRKNDRRFKFTTLYFNENKNVKFYLWPIAKVVTRTAIKIERGIGMFYDAKDYINTINPSRIDFKNLKIDPICGYIFNFGIP